MEFSIGMPDPTKPFPLPRNPWDVTTWAGGSSSGSASGVAAGLFLGGIGTDTGGSIRLPAAYCGISGLKPTFGIVPKSGCIPLSYSLDHVGPMARSAADCAAMLGALAGYEASDPFSVDTMKHDYLSGLDKDIAGLRVGVERANHFPIGSDPAVAECFDTAVAVFERLGADIVEVSLPYYREIVTAVNLMVAAEALAYHRSDLQTRWSDYGSSTRAFMAKGALVTGADYAQAQAVGRVAKRALGELFKRIDVVIMPTSAKGAPRYNKQGELPGTDERADFSFCSYWNAVGNPALAVPMGFTKGGLPLSLQIASRPFEDMLVLRVGSAYQSYTDWHQRVPSLDMDVASPRLERARHESRMSSRQVNLNQSEQHQDEAMVAGLLAQAGLPASHGEVVGLSEVQLRLKAGIDVLYAVRSAQYEGLEMPRPVPQTDATLPT